jgi:hypothetical protein
MVSAGPPGPSARHRRATVECVALARGSAVWARRGVLAAVLIGAALVPGRVASAPAARCTGAGCQRQVAAIKWTRPLPGSWSAQSDALGTVLSQGEAYAGVGSGVAAVGYGLTVVAYQLSTGQPLWATTLTGFPPGSAVVSVRAWTGVLTAGVAIPAALPTGTGGGPSHRDEVVLSATDGTQLRSYPAAIYGGAVAASPARTVIVGSRAVTSYVNATGRVAWRRPTGRVPQAWRVDGQNLLVAEARGGYTGTAPVTALRRINLATGALAVLRPSGRAFDGTLSGAVGDAVLFSGADGLTAYSATDGRLLWQRPGAVPQAVDTVRQILYVASGDALIGVDPLTGDKVTRSASPGAAGLYTVSAGVALGLDEGALGDAWGYDLARKRVLWTTRPIPWPHFFVDLSGIGGSADQSGSTVVLASCAHVGVAASAAQAPPCTKPELVAIAPVQRPAARTVSGSPVTDSTGPARTRARSTRAS